MPVRHRAEICQSRLYPFPSQRMSCGLPREVLKWILSLDLSYAVKNPKRDFANGFLYAEILSRYYPGDVQMHSFENVASMERKKANWALLEKLIKRKRIPVERSQIEAVMAAEGDTAVEVLQAIFNFIHSPSYEASKAAAAATTDPSPDRTSPSQHRDRTYDASTSGQPDFIPMPSQYEQQQQQQQMYGQMPLASYVGGAAAAEGALGGGGMHATTALQSPSMYQYTPETAQQQQPYPGLSQHHHQSYSGMSSQQQQSYAGMSQQQQGSSYGMYAAAAMQLQQQQQQQQQYYAAVQGGSYGYIAQQQGQTPAQAPVGSRVSGGEGGGGGYGMQAQRTPGRSLSPGRAGSHVVPSQPTPAQQSDGPQVATAAGGGYAAAYALAYAEQMRQQAAAANYTPDQQALVYQQALYQYQQQAAAMANGAMGGGGKAGVNQESPEREGLPYSRKPRPVDFKPYDIKAFEDKEYNVKGGRAYWQLGKLGPDLETEELQAKREAKERIKKMAEQVREDNARKAVSRQKQRSSEPAAGGGGGGGAASPAPTPAGGRDKDKEPSARERALQFAKNIPKPEPKPQKKQLSATQSGEAAVEAPVLSELEVLERQHQERQQEVDKIRAELARIL